MNRQWILFLVLSVLARSAIGACLPSHNLKVTVNIRSCTAVTFHSRSFKNEPVNVEDIPGTLLEVQTRRIELLPHAYAGATDPVWLRDYFRSETWVPVFVPEAAELICNDVRSKRFERIIVPIRTCCDTHPTKGICSVPPAIIRVTLEPIAVEN